VHWRPPQSNKATWVRLRRVHGRLPSEDRRFESRSLQRRVSNELFWRPRRALLLPAASSSSAPSSRFAVAPVSRLRPFAPILALSARSPRASRLRPAASRLSSTVGTQAGSVNRGPDSCDRVAPAGVNYGALRQISSSVRPNHPGAEIGGSASKLGERKNSARSKSLTARLNRVRRAGQKPGGLPVGGDACRLGSALRLQRPTRKGHGCRRKRENRDYGRSPPRG
jgi:hypothetical protein